MQDEDDGMAVDAVAKLPLGVVTADGNVGGEIRSYPPLLLNDQEDETYGEASTKKSSLGVCGLPAASRVVGNPAKKDEKMRLSIIFFFLVLFPCFNLSGSQSYNAMFSFGDSLSDTGNVVVAGLPYGMSFFGRPTGRCSNGRLVIDFIGTTATTCTRSNIQALGSN
ncbi:hypothetical protein BHE74_00010879 [Ensete ventricosum]|nr:hypothetical protein BHE74_00010879 [Ensete ventricosum]